MRSLVLARDDGSGALNCLLVDAHFLKTEEHKNKRGIECSNVCSNKLDILLFLQCCCIIDAVSSTYFVVKEQKRGCIRFLKTEEMKGGCLRSLKTEEHV